MKKLNNKIWDRNQKIYPNIRKNLLKIAKDFVKWVELNDIKVKDIILTGSNANMHWNEKSDVDLHIYLDMSKFNEKQKPTILNYLLARKSIWNDSHDIEMVGYEVEIYPEDYDSHQISTGMYSLIKNEWIIRPKERHVQLDKKEIMSFYTPIKNKIDEYEKDNGDKIKLYNNIKKTMSDIKEMRKHGLSSKEKDLSSENLAFKMLRNNDDMKRLLDLKFKTYDDILSINEEVGMTKGQWKLENTNSLSEDKLKRIYDMFKDTYSKHHNILRSVSSPEVLKKNPETMVLDYDNDNELDAFFMVRPTKHGKKIAYLGSENNIVAKAELMKELFNLLRSGGWFIEGGQKIEAACEKYNIPSITDMETVKDIIKTPVLKILDDGFYIRKSGMGATVKKKLYGKI